MISNGRLLRNASPERLLQAIEGKVWQWVIPCEELIATRQSHVVSNTIRRSDGVHIRVVADLPPYEAASSPHGCGRSC